MRFAALFPPILLVACQATTAPAPAPQPSPPSVVEPSDFDQTRAISELKAKIAGRQTRPARQVFQNIQLSEEVPAGRLLGIMEVGYARSLGVTCAHCHVAGEWEKDDQAPKRTARAMIRMMRAINQEYLREIPTLQNESPAVNCTTCHRGQLKPALDLPGPAPAR